MRPVAWTGRGVIELARLLFRRGDEFGECGVRQIRSDQQHRRQIGDMDDRRERSVRIVGNLRTKHMRDRVGSDLGEEQVIAVRLFAHDGGRSDGTARAGAILHDQRLTIGELREAIRQIARQRVGCAACTDRHKETHRPVGPLRHGLCERFPWPRQRRAAHDSAHSSQKIAPSHVVLPVIFWEDHIRGNVAFKARCGSLLVAPAKQRNIPAFPNPSQVL